MVSLEWSIEIENFLKKRTKVKVDKNENVQLFMQNRYRMQILIKKTLLFYHENADFGLIYKIFLKIYECKRQFEGV